MAHARALRWLLGALLCFPAALAGQGPAPRLLRDTLPAGDPIAILLARGGELKLTPAQVTRLGEVRRRLRAANEPLVAQLVTIRREVRERGWARPRQMTPEQRAGFRAAVQRARPLMQAIDRNNVRAMEEIGAVLSPEQKGALRDWLAQASVRGPGRGMGPGAGSGAGAGAGMGAGAGPGAGPGPGAGGMGAGRGAGAGPGMGAARGAGAGAGRGRGTGAGRGRGPGPRGAAGATTSPAPPRVPVDSAGAGI